MDLSKRWLNDYVTLDVPDREYAEALTISGSKVESYRHEGETLQNIVVGKILSLGSAYTDPDAGELIALQLVDDALHTVVSACRTRSTDAQSACRNGDIIIHHDNALGGHLEGIRHIAHSLARQIHVGLRLHNEYIPCSQSAYLVEGLALDLLHSAAAQLIAQLVGRDEACVVAGALIAGAGIAQACHDIVHRGRRCFFFASENSLFLRFYLNSLEMDSSS